MDAAEQSWTRVLQEVRRQAARVAAAAHVQLPDVDGVWFDVQEAEPAVTTSSVRQAEAWHQQQWLVAFEVLVSCWQTYTAHLQIPEVCC